jgi:hypothetical protein
MKCHHDEEWHAYDRHTRRTGVIFHVQEEHFAFTDHRDILDIRMINANQGFVILRTRRRRSFFVGLLPTAEKFLTLHKRRLPTIATPPPWCTGLRIRELLNK